MPTLVGQSETCEASNSTGEDAETSGRPHYPEGSNRGCDKECGSGDTHSDSVSVASGSSRRSGGHYSSSSDVCGGDGAVLSSLTDFNVLRFKNNFLEAVEELRMRRLIDAENEERIKQLFTKTHGLEQKLEEEQSRYAAVTEGHSQQEQEMRKLHEEQLKQLEDEKAKCHLSSEGRERELKALKDEIRTLQLAKYNLEKKVQEQDRQLQLQTSSRDNHLSQMSQLEQKCSTAFRQATEVSEQIERVERNVKQAIELNRKLQYVNSHQQCTIEVCKKELGNCRQELVEARAQLAGQQGEEAVRGGEYPTRMRATEQELKMQVELSRQLQAQLVGLREEHQSILQRLKEAHGLIERHVETNAKLSASEVILQEEVASLKDKSKELEEQLRSSMEQYQSVEEKCQSMEEKWNTEVKEWKGKCADVESRLKTLQADYSALQASHDELEVAKLAAQRQFECQSGDSKEVQTSLEENLKLVQEEIRELKDRSLKESHKWSEKIEKLQTALEQSEQLLAEKEKLLVVARKQYHTLEAKCKEQLQLQANIAAPATTVTCAQGNSGDQQGCLNQSQPLEALSSHMEAKTDKGVSTENQTAAACSIPMPPGSPILSPDVISGSLDSTKVTSSPLLTSIEEPMTVSVCTSKNLLPRIHLEKLHLPLTKHCSANEDNTNRLNVDPAVLQQCTSHADKEADLSPIKNSNVSVLKVAPKRAAEGSVKDSEMGESPTKKPRISVTSESGAAPVVTIEKSTKTADTLESSPISDSGEQSQKKNQGNSQGSSGGSQRSIHMVSSQPHHSQSELPLLLSAEHKMDLKSSLDPKTLSNHRSRGGSLSQPNSLSATNSEHHPGYTSATLPSSWKLETPKLKSLWTGTCPSKAYHPHALSCGPDKQSIPPLNNTARQEGFASNLSVPQNKNRSGFSPQDRGISSMVSQPTNTCNSNSTSVSSIKYSDHDTSQEKSKCTSCPQSPSMDYAEVQTTLTKDDSLVVLFSDDDEEEEDCRSGAATMLSSQMNRQIDRVQMFLRMDRLRRTKPFK